MTPVAATIPPSASRNTVSVLMHGPVMAFVLACVLGLLLGLGACSEISDDESPAPAAVLEPASPGPATVVEPTSPVLDDPRLALARQLITGGGFEQAESWLDAMLVDHPGHPRLRFLRAVAIQKQKRYEVALVELDALAAEDVDFRDREAVDHFRGWCLFYLGRPREAEVAFARHLALQPDVADSEFGRGRALLELGRPAPAIVAFDRALALEAELPDRRRSRGKAWIRRGDALWELDRFEDATASFHKGVVQFPDHYEGWAKLATGHERLGDSEKATWARREHDRARMRLGLPVDVPASGGVTEPTG